MTDRKNSEAIRIAGTIGQVHEWSRLCDSHPRVIVKVTTVDNKQEMLKPDLALWHEIMNILGMKAEDQTWSRKCDACSGTGILLGNDNQDNYEIQRCDVCEKFASDGDAVHYVYVQNAAATQLLQRCHNIFESILSAAGDDLCRVVLDVDMLSIIRQAREEFVARGTQ